MSLLDDLKESLGEVEYNKLLANEALKTKLQRGDELRSYYDGDETPVAPPAPAAGTPPAPTRSTPPPAMDLTGIERMLDSKLSKLDERIDTRFNELVEKRAGDLVNSAVNVALQRSDELNRVYLRHSQDFGEAFDSAKLNEFLEKPENSIMGADGKRVGSKFRTVTEAYDAMTAERRNEKIIESKVAERVAAKTSGQNLPGTTPTPAMNSNIRVFMSRGRATDANGQQATRVDKAATALEKLMARNQEAAS